MCAICLVTVAAVLVPQPREVKYTGGSTTNLMVTCVSDGATLPEGYGLSVSTGGIIITRSSAAGEFYARQTLAQMVKDGNAPCVEIADYPTCRWRGVHIDECRHFFGKFTIRKIIDQMARHKLNVLHWHLTDDQGWRIEIPGYPELAEYAAVRPSSPIVTEEPTKMPDGDISYAQDGERYGPYYYRERDIREIIDYAAKRHVMIVPEIELPGHVAAALAAYPELACEPMRVAHRHPRLGWGISRDVLCLGNDRSIRFLEDVLDFVCKVFPSPYVHIGGDECPRVRWQSCPKCAKRIADEGLRDVGELQAWVTRHFVEFLAKRGRRAVGWDEYLNGEVPQSAIGMSWRTPGQGADGVPILTGAAAAARGHDIIVATHEYVYFNYGQEIREDPFYGRDCGRPLSLGKVYSYDPRQGIPLELHGHLLGGECCNWSENTLSAEALEWKMWPRTCALAEVLWLGADKPGYENFRERMKAHRSRLIADYINCAPVE